MPEDIDNILNEAALGAMTKAVDDMPVLPHDHPDVVEVPDLEEHFRAFRGGCECSPDMQAVFRMGYDFARSRAIPTSRLLKDGHVQVPETTFAATVDALKSCRNKISYMLTFGAWSEPERSIKLADSALDALRSGEAEGRKG